MSLFARAGAVGARATQAARQGLAPRRLAIPETSSLRDASVAVPARLSAVHAPHRALSGAAGCVRPALGSSRRASDRCSSGAWRGISLCGASRGARADVASRASLSTMPPAVVEKLPSTPLVCRADRYRGVIIDDGASNAVAFGDPDAFSAALEASLASWKLAGVRGVWLRLPLSRAPLIPVAASHGFRFHHAEPSYAMMCAWLAEDVPDLLPPNASHQVGVGAFVLDRSRRRVLAVQEALGPLAGTGTWKLPTGLVGVGEDVHEAAVREVFEETGVRTRFGALIAVRQAHGFAFGKSDLFFIVGLHVDDGEGEDDGDFLASPSSPHDASALPPPGSPGSPPRLPHQETELDGARWMALDAFAAQPFYSSRPLFHRMLFACREWAEGRSAGLEPRKLSSDVRTRDDLLFVQADAEADAQAQVIARERFNDQLPDIRHG